MATMNMEGEALKQLLWMDNKGQLNSCCDFMDDVLKRFREGSYAVLTGQLSKLVQIEPVKEY